MKNYAAFLVFELSVSSVGDIAKTMFPNAIVVGDRFHWTAYLNEAINKLRKALRKEFSKVEVFKKIKWSLFKQAEKSDEKDKEQLQNAFALSPRLDASLLKPNHKNCQRANYLH